MSIKNGVGRIGAGLAANGVTQAAQLLIRLVEIPALLSIWGAERYGHWLLLSALPTALSLSDGGFTRTARREMALKAGQGDNLGVLETFQSTFALLVVIGVFVLIAVGLLLPAVPVGRLLGIANVDDHGLRVAILAMIGQVFLYFQCGLLHGAMTSRSRYASGELFIALSLLLVSVGTIAGAAIGGTLLDGAFGSLIGQTSAYFLMLLYFASVPGVTHGLKHVSACEIRRLWKPSIANMAFPVSDMLNIQGVRLAVGVGLGPVELAAFSSLRTLCRAAMQPVLSIARTVEPEMSIAYGRGMRGHANLLFERASHIGIWLSILLAGALALIGPWVYSLWIGGKLHISLMSMFILLLASCIGVVWGTGLTVPCSRNLHGPIAIPFLLLYGLGGTIAVAIFCHLSGSSVGAATGVLIGDVLASLVVLRLALRLSDTTFKPWLLRISRPPFGLAISMAKNVKVEVEGRLKRA